MNRKKVIGSWLGPVARGVSSRLGSSFLFGTAHFRGKLGSAIAVITSLIVGFLTLPSNILYFIESSYGTRLKDGTKRAVDDTARNRDPEKGDADWAYITSGIAMIALGCLAMVVSVVLSYFSAKSKLKLDDTNVAQDGDKSTRTVTVGLVMMNVELFMAVLAGGMELLYKPLTRTSERLHHVECTIAVFNVVIYVMYVVSMILTSAVLRGQERVSGGPPEHSYAQHQCVKVSESGASRDYMTDNTWGAFSTQSGHMGDYLSV